MGIEVFVILGGFRIDGFTGQRIPSPMNATRTVGMGSAANRSMSLCPAGRGGVGVWIMPVRESEQAADSSRPAISSSFFMVEWI